MASYTTSLRLVQPATGEYSGTWGTQVNNGITALVDTSVAGTASITMTAADYTLSTANGATDEARAMFLVLGGTPGAARNVICPAVSKLYYVTNNTTGGFAQTVKTSAGTGISVPNGASMVLRCDGTNVVVAENYMSSLSLGSVLPTGSGGTGLSSYTANGVVYASSASALTTGSGLVFDGTNLGVGTNSPAQKLHVNNTTGVNTYAAFSNPNATNGLYVGSAANGNGIVGTVDIQPLLFLTSAAERMRLDTSGNLGLGVTPSAWQASWKVFSASRDATFGGTDGGSVYGFMAVNAYADGSASPNTATWRYKLTGSLASKYEQTSGMHQWFTAGTGTAGTAITFTQAMTLDASGNLGVGQTSNSARLHVKSNGQSVIIEGTTARGGGNVYGSFFDPTGRKGYWGYGGGDDAFYLANEMNAPMLFFTNNTERARITSDGKLYFASTSSFGGRVNIGGYTNGGDYGIAMQPTANDSTPMRFLNAAGTEIGTIACTSSSTAYNTSSDRRLKTNIAPAADAGAVIDAIEVVQHDWKVGGHTRFGVIAQDLNAVAPEAVTAGDDGDEIGKTWGVDYSKLVPMLIKEIQSLRARVAALEQA